jgi:hypothetical protein
VTFWSWSGLGDILNFKYLPVQSFQLLWRRCCCRLPLQCALVSKSAVVLCVDHWIALPVRDHAPPMCMRTSHFNIHLPVWWMRGPARVREKWVGPAHFSLAGRWPDPPRRWCCPAPPQASVAGRAIGVRAMERRRWVGGEGVTLDVLLLLLPDRRTGLALACSGRSSHHSFADAVA